jgi:hypothetical protein
MAAEHPTTRVHHMRGNLLTAHLTYPQIGLVAQQLNCYSPKPHGLADTFRKAPAWAWANHYGTRRAKGNLNVCIASDCDKPGTIVILSRPANVPGPKMPSMVGLFGQENMGKPSDYHELHPEFKVRGGHSWRKRHSFPPFSPHNIVCAWATVAASLTLYDTSIVWGLGEKRK